MKESIKKNIPLFIIILAGIFILGGISLNVFDKEKDKSEERKTFTRSDFAEDTNNVETEAKEKEVEMSEEKQPKVNMRNILDGAYSWQPVFNDWFGKKAPDFTLTDLKGNKHSLSDYTGKNIILIFWATWCGPCNMEIPHLVELRNKKSKDELIMLAITKENKETVKPFADNKNINYTVLLADKELPEPFNQIQGIPSSFYINENREIKVAAMGLVPLGDMKKILRAEW